jgi:1,2-diacylglycerol 3-alpha-glucosyltransferase
MKIAILSQSYPPMISGAALFAERLANHFAEQGHEVLVLTASDRPDPYQLRFPNLSLVRCRSFHNPLRAGQRFSLWPHKQVIKCLREFSPDLIHVHDPFQYALSSLSFGRLRNIPVMLTIHQLPCFVSSYLPAGRSARRLIENLLWRYARWVMKRCACAVAGTQTTANEIQAHTGISPYIISVGLDLSNFNTEMAKNAPENTLRGRLGIPGGVPIILNVGRLDKDKQVERVVRAAALAMQGTPAHLLIVGDGTERLKLKQLCGQLGIGDRSHFPGFISIKNGLSSLYRISTVFATASEVETQGVVLLEAAASALPIVAVNATCLHEVVHEGINGFLLPPEDSTGFAERLCELIQDPRRAHEMGQRGRQIVESHAEENTFAAYTEVYNTVIQENQFIPSPRTRAPSRLARSRGFG